MQAKNKGVAEMIKQTKGKLARMLSLFVPKAVYEQLQIKHAKPNDYSQKYYSQEGEEIILRRFFNYKNRGFFVDIGAHHPERFSNTYLLYQMGWRGINIDATPGSMREFKKIRKEDINIEAAISDIEEVLKFYEFDDAALNTFDKNKAELIVADNTYKLLNTVEINTHTLAKTLEKYPIAKNEIDFFSIDAEGFDLKILKSNNWNKFKPKVIVIESNSLHLNKLMEDETCIYLHTLGYKPFAKTVKSVFYAL